jgi:hypothetical protein
VTVVGVAGSVGVAAGAELVGVGAGTVGWTGTVEDGAEETT